MWRDTAPFFSPAFDKTSPLDNVSQDWFHLHDNTLRALPKLFPPVLPSQTCFIVLACLGFCGTCRKSRLLRRGIARPGPGRIIVFLVQNPENEHCYWLEMWTVEIRTGLLAGGWDRRTLLCFRSNTWPSKGLGITLRAWFFAWPRPPRLSLAHAMVLTMNARRFLCRTGSSTHGFLCLLKKRSSSSAQVMFHAQSSLPDFPPLPQHAPSPLFPSNGGTHCDPHLGGQSGRLDQQRLFTGYEPNVTAEASSTEVTPTLLPLGRANFGSTYNSGHLCLRKWMRRSMRMLASLLFAQKGEASAAPAGTFHSNRENSVSRSSHIPVTGKPVAIYSHKRKSSRGQKSFRASKSSWLLWTTRRLSSRRRKGSLVKTLWSGISYEITSCGAKTSDIVWSTTWDEYARIL